MLTMQVHPHEILTRALRMMSYVMIDLLLELILTQGMGHAVVICGVNENFGSYAFMDPAVGDYCAGVIYNTSGDWSFVNESSGHRFTMQGYGYYAG